jgi:endonuclease-8
MPEGDTIFRTATTLRPHLEQRVIEAATAERHDLKPESLGGHAVASIEARGKHLLMHLDDGRAIHSHMGMTGSWHAYGHGEPWRKPEKNAHLQLKTADTMIVCFTPKLLELLTHNELRAHPWLARLGPDMLASAFDEAETLQRFRFRNDLPIGEAVMNQTIVCGIGNIYKSEVLFITRTDPFVRVDKLTDEVLLTILRKARSLMMSNRGTSARRTRMRGDGSNFWAYGREGEACFECGETIVIRRQGDLGRTTYYCPNCQGSIAGTDRPTTHAARRMAKLLDEYDEE